MKKSKTNKKIKIKIRKSVRNRFEVTKNGKVLRMSSFNRHLRRKKSKKQLRRLKGKKHVLGAFAVKVKKLLGK
jgi:ribosomal protein L35